MASGIEKGEQTKDAAKETIGVYASVIVIEVCAE